jgi:hypothetical protein
MLLYFYFHSKKGNHFTFANEGKCVIYLGVVYLMTLFHNSDYITSNGMVVSK